jgi:hypothetical protein
MRINKISGLNHYYLPLFLFLLGVFLRISIDGFNLSYPGNLKSVDAFLHTINSNWVSESHQITLAPHFLSGGFADVVFFHPPLLYPIPALMSLWTGIKDYNTIWLYTAFISAIPILILYVIGVKIFHSKKVGILSGVLFLLPATNLSFPETFQLYWAFPTYIGAWNLVMGKTLFIIQLWLLWELWNKPRKWNSLLLGIVTGAQILSHIPETTLAVGLIIAVYLKILKEDFKSNLHHLLLFFIPTTLSFIAFLPKILGVWIKTKPIFVNTTAPILLENFNFMRIFWTPLIVFYALGFLLILKQKRENLYWVGINIYVVLWLGIMPFFFSNEEYFGKLRFVVPFAVFPIVAFGIIWIGNLFQEKVPPNLHRAMVKKIFFVFLLLIFIIPGIAQYNAMKKRMSVEEMTPGKYESMLWIQGNTALESQILLLDGFNIASGLYTKRVTFQRDWGEYTSEIENFKPNESVSSVFHGRWLEELHNLPFQKTFFSYDYHPLPSSTVNPDSFDYVVMWDFNEKAIAYNTYHKRSLMENGFQIDYEKDGITIMGKDI